MLQFWPPIAKFFHELFSADEQLLEETRRQECWRCGGRLDRADFARKARGVPEAFEELFAWRFSLCCAREGCRKHSTPASVRFFGRRVYAGALFVFASAVCALGAFTELQGQYLTIIHTYDLLHGRPPAETDMQAFFRVSPPSVHRMLLELETGTTSYGVPFCLREKLLGMLPCPPRSHPSTSDDQTCAGDF